MAASASAITFSTNGPGTGFGGSSLEANDFRIAIAGGSSKGDGGR